MGKLRNAKKSRGHYAVKRTEDSDEVKTNNLETIILHTKKASYTDRSQLNKASSGITEKPLIAPIPDEILRKDDVVSLSSDAPSATKKDRRIARRRQWIQKLSNFQPEAKTKEKKTPKVADMQTLFDALPTVQDMGQTKTHKCIPKNSKRSLAVEVDNFIKVLDHPAFKEDPLATIQLHLTNARKRGLI